MTITSHQAKELKKRVNALVKAEVAYSWKGSVPTSEYLECIEDLRVARKRFNDYVASLKLWDGRVAL
jgi:hypothetical protein